MKIALIAALLALPTYAAADVSIADNNQVVTVDCAKDKNVSIAGNGAVVTLKGTCERISVAGNRATVKGAAAIFVVAGNNNALDVHIGATLAITGNDNAITWKGAGKDAPKVVDSGKKNTVTRQ